MTMQEASIDELSVISSDPMQALLFAYEMLTAISQGNTYEEFDFLMRREMISSAIISADISADIRQLS